MLKRERQAYIIHQVNLHNKVLSTDLSSYIDVSEDTIRRDLQELNEDGKLIKVHGGALSLSFKPNGHPSSKIHSRTTKKIIADKAIKLIEDGMYVLTGGGNTIIEMARALPNGLKATFVSGSIPAITEYMRHPNIEIIVVGDKLSKTSKITLGTDATARISSMKPDLCFLGINAIDVNNGITDSDWEVVQLKQTMIEASQKVVCLSSSEKINTMQPIRICELSKIDILITELEPNDPKLQAYVAAGVTVL